jgi:hypothetical protein
MTILVSDTSVLIDLERGQLIASAFRRHFRPRPAAVLGDRLLCSCAAWRVVRAESCRTAGQAGHFQCVTPDVVGTKIPWEVWVVL